jgi:type II secretory pathway pseudopilin PulG
MDVLRDERGETLIEILVTLVVISIGLVAIVGMLSSVVIASDAHRGMAEGEVVLRDFGEAIKAVARENREDPATASVEYVHCPDWDDTAFFDPSSFVSPTGWTTPTIAEVEWWIPDATAFPHGTWSTVRQDCTDAYDACGDPIPDCDPGLQRITYTVANTRTDYAGQALTGRVLVRRSNEG